MAYHTIKTIHGKKYLYLQETYREGGKVRTKSKYVGTVDSDGVIHEAPRAKGLSKPNAVKQPIPVASAVVPEKASPQKKSEAKIDLSDLTLQKVNMKCDLSFFRMSEKGILSEYQAMLAKLQHFGIPSEKIPSITLKFGKAVASHKKAFSRDVVVTVPKKKGNREAFRREYRKTLHRVFIETLEQEQPERIAPFLSVFDASFRATQTALFSYMANTNSKDKFIKALALKFFSVIHPIPTGQKGKTLPAEKLGLVAYGKRNNWKDEFCDLMAELDKKGFDTLLSRAHLEIKKAQSSQRQAIKKKTLFFLRKRKTIKRLQARIDANQELIRKLDLLRPLWKRQPQ